MLDRQHQNFETQDHVRPYLKSDSHGRPKPNKHMVVTPIQTCVAFLQRAPDRKPAFPIHAERDERAPLVLRDLVILGVCVSPLRDATPVLTSTDTYIWFLSTVRCELRDSTKEVRPMGVGVNSRVFTHGLREHLW